MKPIDTMEQVNFPKELIFANSSISIDYDNSIKPNKTNEAIIISGNENGFLSLAHLINVYNVYLIGPIIITEFPFVQSALTIEIIEDNNLSELPDGKVIRKIQDKVQWLISETAIFTVTGLLHSLGYANKELHLDDAMGEEETSVYCVVN